MIDGGAMAGDIRIEIKPFDELTLRELHACLKLRGEVFVVGQQICAVADVDELDPSAHHVMLWRGDELFGTARLLRNDQGNTIKVGRVAVTASHRGGGLGTSMMRAIHDWIVQQSGSAVGVMSAQAYLEPWYARLGWVREGTSYFEAGIDHVTMRYTPENSAQASLH